MTGARAVEPESITKIETVENAAAVDKQEPPADQDATIKSLISAYNKARDEYRAASAAATSTEEKKKVKRYSVDDYSADIVAAIEQDVESPAAFDGLRWLYNKTKRSDEQTAEKYLALIMKYHYTRDRIGGVANWIAYADQSEKTEQHLLKILKNNQHEVDLAQTVLAIIRHYQAVKEIQGDSIRRGFAEDSLGRKGMKYIDSRSQEELNLLIDKYFKTGIEKYGEVQVSGKPFGETLEPYHFEHSRLRIGKQVPDIIGEDIDGVRFKLSDYRGKVIMIDFWGDW